MKLTELFHNMKCDCCDEILDEESWYREEEVIQTMAEESGWKHLGGKDYCMECWDWDDDDNIITKDGRKFTEDGEEIKEE